MVTFQDDGKGQILENGKGYTDFDGQARPAGWFGRCRLACCHSWWQKTAWSVVLLTAWSLLMVLPPLAPSEGQLMMLGEKYPQARCLDGSQAGYYVREGDPVKFVIALQGSSTKPPYAPCVTEDACKSLRDSTMGSSLNWKPRIEFKEFPEANQWANYILNPTFSEYTQVFIPYCSGDMWSGTKQYDDWKVWFRGHQIIDATLSELMETRNIGDANTVIFAGGSDGGVGVMLNLDYVANKLSKPNVVGVPIAGWELSNNYTFPDNTTRQPYISLDEESLKNYYHLWGSYVPQSCNQLNHEAPWRCMVADGSFETMQFNVFVVNAQTDAGAMTHYDGMPHAAAYKNASTASKEYMAEWAQRLNSSLEKVMDKPGQGLFAPACYMHQGFGYTQPTINNLTYIQAFEQWLNRHKVKLQDDCGPACNPTCPESTT